MADFLSNIFNPILQNASPMDTEVAETARQKARRDAAMQAAIDEAEDRKNNHDDYALAEEPSAAPTSLVPQSQIVEMSKFKRSPFEETAQDRILASQNNELKPQIPDIQQLAQEQKPKSKVDQYSDLLNTFKSLKPMQEQYQQSLGGLAIQQGANQIAQGLARGYGTDIGAGEAGIKVLQQQAAQPLEALQQQMQVGKANLGLETEMQMNDPNSDISKFAIEQAINTMLKLNPKADRQEYIEKFKGMSASQLEKLPGMKSISGSLGASPWIATDRVDKDGNPIRFNKISGEYSTADGQTIQPGDYTARDILRKDTLTGSYGIGNVGLGMKILPTQYDKTINTSKEVAGSPHEVTYGEFARKAPELSKRFDKVRDDFNKDMKDSRQVATSVTNLAHKLTPGKNGEIDSGTLGGIQSQAAKMAGQVGVLTDQDLVKFAGAGGVKAKLERLTDDLQGNMSDSDIKFFKRFGELMGDSLNEDILNKSQLYIEQGRQIIDTVAPGITSSNVSNMLGVNKVAPIVQSTKKSSIKQPKKTPSGYVHIIDSDGVDHYLPKENLEAAKKRDKGLKVVGE